MLAVGWMTDGLLFDCWQMQDGFLFTSVSQELLMWLMPRLIQWALQEVFFSWNGLTRWNCNPFLVLRLEMCGAVPPSDHMSVVYRSVTLSYRRTLLFTFYSLSLKWQEGYWVITPGKCVHYRGNCWWVHGAVYCCLWVLARLSAAVVGVTVNEE